MEKKKIPPTISLKTFLQQAQCRDMEPESKRGFNPFLTE